MVSVALRVSEEFKSEIEQLPWVNWSELAREELIEQEKTQEAFKRFKEIVSKSKLTEEDVQELSDEVNVSLAKRYAKLLKEHKSKGLKSKEQS